MFKLDEISNNIAEKISVELKFDSDKKQVIAYGAFVLIQTIISITIVFVFGLILGVGYEAILISFTASILRKYSGGAHASTPLNCIIIGTVICLSEALFVNIVVGFSLDFLIILIIGVLIFFIAILTIYILVPVDNVAKPIKSAIKKKRMKKQSYMVLGIYLLVVIVSMLIYFKSSQHIALVTTLCIYLGILWQVFTLTKSGHSFLKKVDLDLNNIMSLLRRIYHGKI